MNELVFSVTSITPFGHRDCLMLISATSKEKALERVLNETTILDVVEDNNIELKSIPTLATDRENFICIFADDIYYA